MIATCSLCKRDFITEADPYVVRPTPQGYEYYCSCMIIGHDQISGVDKVKEENKKLHEALKKLVGHVGESLLFPHKSKLDLFKSELEAKRLLEELEGLPED